MAWWISKVNNKICSIYNSYYLCIYLHISIHLKTVYQEGSKGIRQWPIIWWQFLMMIHKMTLYRLQLVVETFWHLTKWTNQSEFNESSKNCSANEKNINSTLLLIKLWITQIFKTKYIIIKYVQCFKEKKKNNYF